MDTPPKGLSNQAQTVRKPSISEDFWTTSTLDMENSAVMSQGSISSISTSNQTIDPNNGAGGATTTSEFVNHGKYSLLYLDSHVHVMCKKSAYTLCNGRLLVTMLNN